MIDLTAVKRYVYPSKNSGLSVYLIAGIDLRDKTFTVIASMGDGGTLYTTGNWKDGSDDVQQLMELCLSVVGINGSECFSGLGKDLILKKRWSRSERASFVGH